MIGARQDWSELSEEGESLLRSGASHRTEGYFDSMIAVKESDVHGRSKVPTTVDLVKVFVYPLH